ncbi:lysine-specific demethylase NO66 [Trypanosoma grayi]|uniref:lysine-specific demethylase NO66 n=1 Tax=Trypanosoma grayi TaxID=71804 RepID=UPI0004F3F996|nr:lysine-specific demethylase NO66 [Trypanosoma grayi]KEG08929.1 lysine-specific demethylase NO66 [Trypanosoma grayi]
MKSSARKRVREEAGTSPKVRPPRGPHDVFFKWLLGITQRDFFKQYFEQKPLHVSHGTAAHFTNPPAGLPAVEWSTGMMLRLVAEKTLSYTADVNVVRFDKAQNKRVPYCVEGVVTAKEMRKCMEPHGWSVRFLRPHEHVATNSALISVMEEIFGCYCGLNSYWTAAGSQGFAPHYDDVDVFLLQLEGEKEWRLYDPPEAVDVLSRHSSEDYVPQQLPQPTQTLCLVPGDVLYMPRGTVHQGRTFDHTHSLHVTFSANQMNTWADLIKCAVTHAAEKLAANHVAWRTSLPRCLLKTLGAVHHPVFRADSGVAPLTEKQQRQRRILQTKYRELAAELSLYVSSEASIDECCDLYARDTVAKLQPPLRVSTAAHAEGRITGDTVVRLVSSNCARVVLDTAGEAQVYHSCGNSPVCLEQPVGLLRFELDFAPALATIMSASARGVCASQLPFPAFDNADDIQANQVTLVKALLDAGIIVTV